MKIKLDVINNGRHEGVRGAFLQLFEPKTVNGEGEPAYSGAFLIDPDTVGGKKLIADIEAGQREVAKAKWGVTPTKVKLKGVEVTKPKWEVIYSQMEAADKLALHDGDKKAEYDGFPGMMFVSSRSKVRPLAIDRDRSPVTAVDGRIYSGCYVIAEVELWAQDNSYGKRINAQLKGVQFVRDGDAFGGGGTPASADAFDDLSVEDEGTAVDDGDDLV